MGFKRGIKPSEALGLGFNEERAIILAPKIYTRLYSSPYNIVHAWCPGTVNSNGKYEEAAMEIWNDGNEPVPEEFLKEIDLDRFLMDTCPFEINASVDEGRFSCKSRYYAIHEYYHVLSSHFR